MNEGRRYGRLFSRRDFVVLTGLAAAGTLAGCATNPVTGKKQLLFLSKSDEIRLDGDSSPHQFSADYGTSQDALLNGYVAGVGTKVAAVSHRPRMPYSYRCVNAGYVNAYAFPGGSIAATRGILLELDNEAELAGLLGHEVAHVCARHAAERMTQAMLTQLVVVGLAAYVAYEKPKYAPLAAGLGGIGAGALLAKYSRDDERQADSLGMEYMTKAGYNPAGMVGLMEVLRRMSKRKPNAIERMFASHPMSDERYKTAQKAVLEQYAAGGGLPDGRESYMDHTAGLRKIKGAIDKMQNGEEEMTKGKHAAAEEQLSLALKEAPNDYAGLVLMAKCKLVQKKSAEAARFAEEAKQVYPAEAQAYHVCGMARMEMKKYDDALAEFNAYESKLPGNPNTTFYKGLAYENMNQRDNAVSQYTSYLRSVDSGDQAQHAYKRLVEWGVIKVEPQPQTQQQPPQDPGGVRR